MALDCFGEESPRTDRPPRGSGAQTRGARHDPSKSERYTLPQHHERYQNSREARRAPSAMAASLAQTMSGSTAA